MKRQFVTKEWLTKESALNYQYEIEDIINQVFNHGKNSPDKSYDLSKGEMTIADAVSKIMKIIISLEGSIKQMN